MPVGPFLCQSISRRKSPGSNPFRSGGRRVFYLGQSAVRPHACRWEKANICRWVSNRVVAPAASLAGVAGRWPARRRSRTKRTESSTKPTKTFHTPVHRKQRTAHREPRRHARDMQRRVDRRAAGDYTPRASQGAKFSSRGALFAKQRKRVTGRSHDPSPHPASSRDGDGAQNAAVLACCGLREARTRVRARAAYTVCVCVQYGTSEIVHSESPPPAFPRFSCPEMNARPRAADSEI